MSPAPTDAKRATESIDAAGDASQTLPKVQLDIDDAPFMKEKEPEPPPPAPVEAGPPDALPAVAPPPAVDADASKKRKRRIIIGAAILFLLLAGGGGGFWWFKFRVPPPPPPPPPKPQVIVVPSAPPDKAVAEFLISFSPFWLEVTSDAPREKDRVFFLTCKFTAITKTEATLQEAQNKNIVLRDALYFYLKHKTYEFLTNPDNAPGIKKDLTAVINGYLTGNNQVDDVLFERYVAK